MNLVLTLLPTNEVKRELRARMNDSNFIIKM